MIFRLKILELSFFLLLFLLITHFGWLIARFMSWKSYISIRCCGTRCLIFAFKWYHWFLIFYWWTLSQIWLKKLISRWLTWWMYRKFTLFCIFKSWTILWFSLWTLIFIIDILFKAMIGPFETLFSNIVFCRNRTNNRSVIFGNNLVINTLCFTFQIYSLSLNLLFKLLILTV